MLDPCRAVSCRAAAPSLYCNIRLHLRLPSCGGRLGMLLRNQDAARNGRFLHTYTSYIRYIARCRGGAWRLSRYRQPGQSCSSVSPVAGESDGGCDGNQTVKGQSTRSEGPGGLPHPISHAGDGSSRIQSVLAHHPIMIVRLGFSPRPASEPRVSSATITLGASCDGFPSTVVPWLGGMIGRLWEARRWFRPGAGYIPRVVLQ